MKLELSHDQIAMQRSLRQVLTKECPTSLVRELQSNETVTQRPEALWSALSSLGFFGLALEEQWGGQGIDLFDLGLAYQEAGRHLCPTTVYSTIAFGLVLQAVGTDQQRHDWLKPLTAGQVLGSLAIYDPSDAGTRNPRLLTSRNGDKWTVHGELDFVLNADLCDVMFVTASDQTAPAQVTLGFLVSPDSPGVEISRHKTHAGDVQCRVTFHDVEISNEAVVENLDEAKLAWLANLLTGLQCMEMVGGAQRVLDDTAEYVAMRHQFGRSLGSFQAVQHRIADMRIATDAARLTAWQAMSSLAKGRLSERETVIAKLQCNEGYTFTTLTAHILWGGMGYIVETDLHLWSSRAKSTELLGGARDTLLARLEDYLELSGGPTSASA